MAKLFANSGDLDQTPHSAVSNLGLHCLPVTILLVSRLQWVKVPSKIATGKVLGGFFQRKLGLTFYVNCLLGRQLTE